MGSQLHLLEKLLVFRSSRSDETLSVGTSTWREWRIQRALAGPAPFPRFPACVLMTIVSGKDATTAAAPRSKHVLREPNPRSQGVEAPRVLFQTLSRATPSTFLGRSQGRGRLWGFFFMGVLSDPTSKYL